MIQVHFRPKEGNKERWEILVDGEKWREVHRSVFGRAPSLPPVSEENELQSVFDAYEYRRVKGYVLWRLSTQTYHSEQLAKLLRDRLVQSHAIEQVIREYRAMGALDDEAWLQSFMRLHQQRYSFRDLLNKLRSKGFSAETISRLSEEWKNPDEEFEALHHLMKSRYRSKDLTDYKTRQKVIASLARKGYTFDQIQKVFKCYQTDRLSEVNE